MSQFGQVRGQPAPNFDIDYPAEVLLPEEMDALLGTCSTRAPTGIRDRALLKMLSRSGIRISEAVGAPARPECQFRSRDGQVKVHLAQPAIPPLRISDVDLAYHSIRVTETKSGKAQTRGWHPSADDALLRWLDVRKTLGLPRSAPLFCTLKGTPMHPQQVRNMVKRRGAKAGIDKQLHPHMLRHTFADELRRAGMDVVMIRDLLGHSSIAVTNRYLHNLGNYEAVEALQGITLR